MSGSGPPSHLPGVGAPRSVSVYGSPTYIGAACSTTEVSVFYGDWLQGGQTPDGWNVGYGQRRSSRVPVFSHQVNVRHNGPKAWFQVKRFATRPLAADVYAFFRTQHCLTGFLSRSTCSPWSQTLTVHLGPNELTAY